jgi:hypothetical protein
MLPCLSTKSSTPGSSPPVAPLNRFVGWSGAHRLLAFTDQQEGWRGDHTADVQLRRQGRPEGVAPPRDDPVSGQARHPEGSCPLLFWKSPAGTTPAHVLLSLPPPGQGADGAGQVVQHSPVLEIRDRDPGQEEGALPVEHGHHRRQGGTSITDERRLRYYYYSRQPPWFKRALSLSLSSCDR